MGVELLGLEELFSSADFVSIHLPKSPETIGLVGKELLAKAKPGIRIVNAARGGIVDEEALADASLRGKSPVPRSTCLHRTVHVLALFELERVVVTPHLGASTAEAQDKAGEQIARRSFSRWRATWCPSPSCRATGASEAVREFVGSRSDWAACWRHCAKECQATSRSSTRGTSQARTHGFSRSAR